MLYLFVLLLLIFLSYYYDYLKASSYNKTCYVLVCIFFICIVGLRYRIGVDTAAYQQEYAKLPTLSELSYFDFDSTRYGRGYIFLNAVARSISDNFVVMQFFIAIFTNTVLFWFFNRYTNNKYTCLLVYFICGFTNFSFEILRESIAVSIFLLAFPFYIKNSWIKYYLLAVLAIFFHPSAAILLLIPILKIYPIKWFFQLGTRTIFISFLMFFIGIFIAKQFFDIITLLEISTLDNYANVYSNTHYAEAKNINIFGLLSILISLAYPYLALLLQKKKIISSKILTYPDGKKILESFQIVICCLIYLTLLSLSIRLVSRFSNYFYLFIYVIISDSLFNTYSILKHKLKFSYGVTVLLLLPYLFLPIKGYFSNLEPHKIKKLYRYYPYENVITEDENETRENLFTSEWNTPQ